MQEQSSSIISSVLVMLIAFGLELAGIRPVVISGAMAGAATFVITAGAIMPSVGYRLAELLREVGIWIYAGMVMTTGVMFSTGISAYFMLGFIGAIGVNWILSAIFSK